MTKHYQSDIAYFLKKYKKENPNTEALQRAGRALLWERKRNLPEVLEGFEHSRILQKGYVYQLD